MIHFFSQILAQHGYKPILIVMDGQSNNGGKGEISELPTYLTGKISDTVKIWDGVNASMLEGGVNQMGQVIKSDGVDWETYLHGSELELGYRLNQFYPNREVFFVKTGQGGRPLGQDVGIEDFSENSVGELHKYLIDNVFNFLASISKSITDFEVWYIWMQGEYDCRIGQDVKANAYNANLTSKISAVKNSLNNQDINFIINVINSTIDRDTSLIPIVRQAQINVANSFNNVYFQLSESWGMVDTLHFNGSGQISKGLGESEIILASSN